MQQMVQNMMQYMMQDPNMREQLLNRDPMIRGLAESNPQVAEMLQNPEFLRMMTSPEMIRMSMQMQQAMRGGAMNPSASPGFGGYSAWSNPSAPQTQSAPSAGTAGATAGAGAGAGAADLARLMNMFGSAGAGAGVPPLSSSAAAAAPAMTQDQLEQLYATQLQQLRDMGFMDTGMCINALQRSGGNVNLAVERLLSQFGQM